MGESRKHHVNIGDIFDTNAYGKIEIIEDLGCTPFEDKRYRYKIRFLNTGHEKIVRKDAIVVGQVKDNIPVIDFNSVMDSDNYGKFKIIEYLGKIRNRDYVKVRFVDSGGECELPLYNVMQGKVKDPMFGYNPNKIFQSNISGPFKMIEYLGKRDGHAFVKIQFLNTGTVRDVQMYNAIDGKVSDPILDRRISNDFSIDRFNNYDDYITKKLREKYNRMVKRCTDKNWTDAYRFYGEIGITVCDRWMEDINNFLEDARKLPGFDKYYLRPYLYELDKDYLQQNIPKEHRVYSPETCMFLYKQDNINLKSIEYRLANPDQPYFGVSINSAGNFQAGIIVNGEYKYLGVFDDPIAAANMFNYAAEWYHDYELVSLFNDVPFMTINEIMTHRINVKQLYTLIKKE